MPTMIDGFSSGSSPEDGDADVAFIGGEQGVNRAQVRQNQQNEGEGDVAFIGGESGVDPMRVRQNEQYAEDGAPCPNTLLEGDGTLKANMSYPDVISQGWPLFVEGGSDFTTDFLGAHRTPDTSVPPVTVNYLGGTMLI